MRVSGSLAQRESGLSAKLFQDGRKLCLCEKVARMIDKDDIERLWHVV